MNPIIIGMLAETFVHSGIGQAISAIDLPVARERTTDYPFIPGAGKKGGWKSWAKEQGGLEAETDTLFGKNDNAGAILFADARLVLLPVRSLNTAYVWLTCPLLLERLARDIARTGGTAGYCAEKIKVRDGNYLSCIDFGDLALEEREFVREGQELPERTGVLAALKKLISSDPASSGPAVRLDQQLVIISNKEFAWFAKYALPVSAHNKLNETTKTSENLWYEETLPPDTVMYTLLAERKDTPGSLAKIAAAIATNPYCQFGGNETLGQGWFHMTIAYQTGDAHVG